MSDFLEIDGWHIEKIIDKDLEWWADEIWELKSTWSPQGSSAHLTFLVAPQHEGIRYKGQNILAIGASKILPKSRKVAEGIAVIILNKKFKENIREFSFKLDELRTNE